MTVFLGPQLDPVTSVPKRPYPGPGERAGRSPKAHDRAYKEGTVTLREKPGPVSFEEAKAWYNAQIPYENLASDPGIAERAVRYVRERKRVFHDNTLVLRRRWRIVNHMLHGNSVANLWGLEDIHVPEIYKMLETIVPRVVDAILDFDPFFAVRGREEMDRAVEHVLAAFLDYQLDEAKVRRLVEPTVRCMFTYSFAAWKLDWDRQFEWGIDTDIEEVRSPGQVDPEYIIRKNKRYKMKYDGPACRLVDPFDFIIDLAATNAQDALFVGDTHDATYKELMQKGEIGLYKNIGDVYETAPYQEDHNNTAYDKFARAIASTYDQHRRDPVGSPKVYRETELHCKFNLYNDGEEIDCILNVVNDQVCVRAIENFYDKKFRPYAIARAAKEGFDFFNVGPLDHGVRVNEELDQHRSLWLESAKLSVAPLAFTERTADVPESLFGIRPGTVFQGVGKISFAGVPDTMRSVPFVQDTLRRDIEEITGAPRIFEATSSGEGATATEINRKIEEGNRRLKGYVRVFSEMIEDALQIIYFLDGQFLTKKQTFRVLGKQAKSLGNYANVNPMQFQNAIDFEFKGLSSLHTMGLRATALARFLEIMFPYLQMVPNLVNIPALAQDFYRLTVGLRPEDDIIKMPTDLSSLMPPEQENQMLMAGHAVNVDPLDDHDDHFESHFSFFEENHKKMTEEAKRLTQEHILTHEAVRRQSELEEVASRKMQPGVVQQAGLAEQQSPTAGGDMGGPEATTQPGEAAGPPSLFKIGTPGRDPATFQTENQARAG